MKSDEEEDLHESETPPPPNLHPKEQKFKDAVMKLYISRHSSESPSLRAQKLKLIQEKIPSFYPALNIRPTHPPYATMVMKAIKEMNEGGSNLDEISEYIKMNFPGLPFAHSGFLKYYLTKMVESGEILFSYSNACYALPDVTCKPILGSEKEHEQQQQEEKKRSRGRLRKKYVEGGDGSFDFCDLKSSLQEESVVQTEPMQVCNIVEMHQRVDYSDRVIGLEAHLLQPQHLVPETPKKRGRGRPRKIHAHQQEAVEQHQHHSVESKPVAGAQLGSKRTGRLPEMPVTQERVEQCHPYNDSSPVGKTEEGPLQQRKSRGRGRPRKILPHQQDSVEQHHQNAEPTPVVETEPALVQKPCRGIPLRMQIEEETVEQCIPTSDSNIVVQTEGGSSQQRQPKRRGRPPKKPVNQETVKHHTPIVENNTVVGTEVGPSNQLVESQGLPSEKCEAEQSEMTESTPIFYVNKDGLIVLGDDNTLTSVVEASAAENQPKEGDAEQIQQMKIIEQQHRHTDGNLAVGTEVGYVQAEMRQQCETEHTEAAQMFNGDGNSFTSVVEAPPIENQPQRTALADESDIGDHRNTNVNLDVGTEVAHLGREIVDKCGTEQAPLSQNIQTFHGDEDGSVVLGARNGVTSVIEAPNIENQPRKTALTEEGEIEQIHEVGIIEQPHKSINVNLAVGTEVAHLQEEMNDKCETEQAELSESIQMFSGDEDGPIVLGYQPPRMVLAEENDTEQMHQGEIIEQEHRNTNVNLAVGFEDAKMQAEMIESIQTFYGDEDGSMFLDSDSFSSVMGALPLKCQRPQMAHSEEGDTEQVHQQGMIVQHDMQAEVNDKFETEQAEVNDKFETEQAEVNDKFETEQAEMSESIPTFYGTEDGLIVLGNGDVLVIEALPLKCQPPWMPLSEEGDSELIHQQGIIEQQHQDICVNLAIGTEVEHMQAEVNDKCETGQAQTSEIGAPPLESQPPGMATTKESSNEQVVTPDKRQKGGKRRKEVIPLHQLQQKRQLRPRPHEPYKGRLRKPKPTTYL